MKALYYDEQKGYQGIKVGDLPVPEPGDYEVLVRVKAFSLNHLDAWIMDKNYPAKVPLPHVFGSDASGIVDRVGKAIQHIKPGDEVIVFPGLSCGHCEKCLSAAVKRTTNGELADIAVDHVGADTFNKTLSCLKRGGRLVTFGATSGDEVKLSLRHVFGKNITIHGVYVGPKAAMQELLKFFPHGLRTVVDSVFEFNEAKKAYEKLLSRQFFGKIVVKVQH